MLGIYLYFNFVVNFFVLLNLIYYGFTDQEGKNILS